MYDYTIPICNYNMSETLEESLRSILTQVTDDYEVLVVDGGSTDGSIEILEQFDGEYENFRFVALARDPNRHLGGDRRISVNEAAGEYLLLHLDADDHYENAILDFVTIYHQIESQIDRELVLVGSHITMIRKDHLDALGGYRNLQAAEDIDLWRRAIADGGTRYLWLDCNAFWENLGYEKDLVTKTRRLLAMKTAEFQIGISLPSYLRWVVTTSGPSRVPGRIAITLLAYLSSLMRERYDTVDGLSDIKTVRRRIGKRTTLADLDDNCGIEIDCGELRPEGRQYFPYCEEKP